MVYKCFDKKTLGSGVESIPQNQRSLDLAMQQLAEELHKPINRKFKESISKFNKGFRFLLCY